MSYAIIYSSKTGNTKQLAGAISQILPKDDCVYMGAPSETSLTADKLYIGFWTDKGSCEDSLAEFLGKIKDKQIFLFGTAGFGGETDYFETILQHVCEKIDDSNTIIGTYMCQGKMPYSVRERYEKMLQMPNHAPNVEAMIANFDLAQKHPNQEDLTRLKDKILEVQ